jgi:hypothetical protein
MSLRSKVQKLFAHWNNETVGSNPTQGGINIVTCRPKAGILEPALFPRQLTRSSFPYNEQQQWKRCMTTRELKP